MFELKFSTANAAFDDLHGEVARILRAVAEQVDNMHATFETRSVQDENGNTVGKWKLTKS